LGQGLTAGDRPFSIFVIVPPDHKQCVSTTNHTLFFTLHFVFLEASAFLLAAEEPPEAIASTLERFPKAPAFRSDFRVERAYEKETWGGMVSLCFLA
jgi:hypothetical protein